ncbi:twin-arginine translocase subunit TatC [Acanthopleuribacter pedis]|uniref:Sec-independent protein translocase protein TatC n=1 Tax=Acanthopleuribacter pedis TaxID=442870 RepID=A0A8J7QII1_9BACT|nr:twin-arginine translocase subunit TatC [Acanthopleuribacter pedis]MBO1323010.1 twin-arginine translocase subunit TatC [Acanthopleuribacter pedis]
MTDPNEMGFFDHLEELRNRLIKSVGLWLIVFVICFIYAKPIFAWLAEPLVEISKSEHLFAATRFEEPFLANMRAAFWTSLILSSLIFFYHFWGFVAPALTKEEKWFAIPFIIFMALFFIAGCWFSFEYVFPYALSYLMEWNAGELNAFTRSSYLHMLFLFVMGMGVSFELPLVLLFLAKVGLVTSGFLLDKFRYAVVIIFIAAAIITPTPDPFMQTFLAAPILLLYLLGTGLAWLVQKKDEEEFEAMVQGADGDSAEDQDGTPISEDWQK